MIQLCFGDSVKGTLTCAPHIGNTIGGATAVVISTDKPLDTRPHLFINAAPKSRRPAAVPRPSLWTMNLTT